MNNFDQEFWRYTEELWKDKGIQQCYDRANEYQLIDCAKYFLDKVKEINTPEYIPNEQVRAKRNMTKVKMNSFE